MVQGQKKTDQIIREAARKVFQREGYEGARMQAIADEANINKAMLHYYHRSKEKLFDEVFEEDYMTKLVPLIMILRDPSIPVEEQIIRFTREYLNTMIAEPRLALFIMYELGRNPDRLLKMAKKMVPVSQTDETDHPKFSATTFMDQIREGIEKGIYNDINPDHFAVSFLGMCTYPIAARSTVRHAYQMDDSQYNAFLRERKYQIVEHAFRVLMKPEYFEKRIKTVKAEVENDMR